MGTVLGGLPDEALTVSSYILCEAMARDYVYAWVQSEAPGTLFVIIQHPDGTKSLQRLYKDDRGMLASLSTADDVFNSLMIEPGVLKRRRARSEIRIPTERSFDSIEDDVRRMRRDFFSPTPEPTNERKSLLDQYKDQKNVYSSACPSRYGRSRPDTAILFNVVAMKPTNNLRPSYKGGQPGLLGDRSVYLPATPKVQTVYPRFHKGFHCGVRGV